MTSKRDISNYPEHLNPFHEDTLAEKMKFWTLGRKNRSGSFSSSLKELKHSLRQSFRGKKNSNKQTDDTNGVELRNRSGSTANYRQAYTITIPRRNDSPSPALPRSRISERINMSQTKTNDVIGITEVTKNPFETDRNKFAVEKEKRKRKKRAPLPPSLSNNTINEELGQDYFKNPHTNSKWSITSAETDVSSNYTASEIGDDVEISNDNINRAFKNFTNDIEKLADDTNNNNVVANDKKEVPDIVVSCESKDNNNDIVINKNSVISDDSIKQNGHETINDENDCNDEETENNINLESDLKETDIKKMEDLQENNETDVNLKNEAEAPTPKVRKSKLNRNALLGNDFPYADT